MRRRGEKMLDRWLAAEAAARSAGEAAEASEAAEAALVSLFAVLPRPVPPAGFAERVVARAGVVATRSLGLHTLLVSRPFKGLVAACLLVAGSSLLALSGLVVTLVERIRLADALRLVTDRLVALAEWLQDGVVFWETLARLAGAFRAAAATPEGAGALAAALAVSVLAFRLLQELIARDRSWSHVEA